MSKRVRGDFPLGSLCPWLLLVMAVSAWAETAATLPADADERNRAAFTIRIVPGGWGSALTDDIERLLIGVARDIRANFGDLPKRVLLVEHGDGTPITLYRRGPNDECLIQLTSVDTRWAQFSYQFAHELCHVLANYEKKRDARGPNQWFEETLCETSSLYALRRMAVTWKTAPPFPNWSDYTPSLTAYADEAMRRPARQLPAGTTLAAWFGGHRDHLRRNPVERELNGLVANQLLPLFEQDPTRWDAIRFLNLGDDEHDSSLAAYLAGWRDRVPDRHRAFIKSLLTLFGYDAEVTVDVARAL